MSDFWDNPDIETIKIEKDTTKLDKSSNLDSLFACQKEISERSKKEIVFSPPIIIRNDKSIIFPKTIAVIQGKAGTHKSRLVEHIASVLLSKESHNTILDINVNPTNQYTVVYIDTERNPIEQFPAAIQSIKINAGYKISDDIPNFEFISLLAEKREKRLDTISYYLKEIREKYSNHIIIIIDVLTDVTKNFNDVGESLRFIDLLNELINKYDITVEALLTISVPKCPLAFVSAFEGFS